MNWAVKEEVLFQWQHRDYSLETIARNCGISLEEAREIVDNHASNDPSNKD